MLFPQHRNSGIDVSVQGRVGAGSATGFASAGPARNVNAIALIGNRSSRWRFAWFSKSLCRSSRRVLCLTP